MKSTLNLFFTLLLLLLLVPAVASAQTKTCPKCKRAIQVSQYAAHQATCKGITPPKPTTQRCPQCGNQVLVAQYSSHVASHSKPVGRSRDVILQDLKNSMVFVEGGRFDMGALPNDKDADSDETPRHQVTLSSFYISKYEVTQELWQAVMGSNPSYCKGDLQRPVELVSWNECQTFIRKLNALTGEQFRLPTEAEWEYAARGGQKSLGYLYSGSNDIGSVAWYDDNSNNSNKTTHPVGQKQPNELGLYDMSGNVYEWCQDWKGSYSSSAQTNPTGPASASDRVNRGGGWFSSARNCRASRRSSNSPDGSFDDLGLRLAR